MERTGKVDKLPRVRQVPRRLGERSERYEYDATARLQLASFCHLMMQSHGVMLNRFTTEMCFTDVKSTWKTLKNEQIGSFMVLIFMLTNFSCMCAS